MQLIELYLGPKELRGSHVLVLTLQQAALDLIHKRDVIMLRHVIGINKAVPLAVHLVIL